VTTVSIKHTITCQGCNRQQFEVFLRNEQRREINKNYTECTTGEVIRIGKEFINDAQKRIAEL